MAISSDYSAPVVVNGFTCRNCTDVSYAKKHIDPEHPKSGPFGVNAASDPTRQLEALRLDSVVPDRDDIVRPPPDAKAVGGLVDFRV